MKLGQFPQAGQMLLAFFCTQLLKKANKVELGIHYGLQFLQEGFLLPSRHVLALGLQI